MLPMGLTKFLPLIKTLAFGGLTVAGLLGTQITEWQKAREREAEVANRTELALNQHATASRQTTSAINERVVERCQEARSARLERSNERLQTYEEAAANIPKPQPGGPVCPKNCRVP